MVAPEMLNLAGKENLEGVFVVLANWPGKGKEKVVADYKKKTGEPWMTQESISTYGDMWFFKEAVEQAGSIDRKKVETALRNVKDKSDVAGYYAGNTLSFDDAGKRIGATVVIMQWQDGEPKIVFPTEAAVTKPRWPAKKAAS